MSDAAAARVNRVEKALTLTNSTGSDAIGKFVEKYCRFVAGNKLERGWSSAGTLGCGGNDCTFCAAAAAAAAAAAEDPSRKNVSKKCESSRRAASIDTLMKVARKIMRLVAHATISSSDPTPQTSAEALMLVASRIEEGIAAVQELYNISKDWNFVERAYKNLCLSISLSKDAEKALLTFWDEECEAGMRRGASLSPPAALESSLATRSPSSSSPLPAATAYAAAADSTSPDADSREETPHDYDWLSIDPGTERLGFARCYGGETPRLEIGWVNLAHVDKTTTQFIKGPKKDKELVGASRLGALRRALPQVFKGSPRRVFLEGYNDRGDKQPGKLSAGGVKRGRDGAPARAGAPMSGTRGQGYEVNHEVRGVIKEFASSVPHPPEIVHSWLPVSWKAAGQGLMIKDGEGASKSAVRDSVEAILGRPLGSDHMRSQANRKIKLPDDVSDAVGVGLYGCYFYRLTRTYAGATVSEPIEIRADKIDDL